MSGWEGGYGDTLGVEEVLSRYDQRAQVIASEWAKPGAPRDDLAQEARIEAWRVAATHPGEDVGGLVTVAMRRKVAAAALHERWTGSVEDRKGQAKDPIRRQPSDVDFEIDNGLMLIGPDLLDGVEWAYHRGEIMQAINLLTYEQREYVLMRFWRGMSDSEVAAMTGRTRGNVNRTWVHVIRPRLATSLAHLRSSC